MLIRPYDRRDQFAKLKKGQAQKGLTTGFIDLDEHLKLMKGYMMIVTGYPGCGKSEFLDAILVNMSLMHNWKMLYYSPENHPTEQHMCKLAEKYIGKHITTFTQDEIDKSLDYLDKHFTWMYPENPELDTLLGLTEEVRGNSGVDCLVIDPWNSVTHHRGAAMVHEYLSEALSKLIRLSRGNKAKTSGSDDEMLVSVVAHPKNPVKDKDGNFGVPTLYDISDGAMWRNKADYGMVCHRPNMAENRIEIYMQKLKYKWMGKLGMATLDYNYQNGRFKGLKEAEFYLPTDVVPPF